MIPFMCSDLERLLRNILNLFVKQEVIYKCSTPIQLNESDIHKKDNLLKGNSIKLGFAAEIRLTALRKEDPITNIAIERLGKDSTNLYVRLVEKFMEQTPLGSIILSNSQVLNQNALIIVSAGDAEKKYKSLLTHLISLKYVSPVFPDKTMNQFTHCTKIEVFH